MLAATRLIPLLAVLFGTALAVAVAAPADPNPFDTSAGSNVRISTWRPALRLPGPGGARGVKSEYTFKSASGVYDVRFELEGVGEEQEGNARCRLHGKLEGDLKEEVVYKVVEGSKYLQPCSGKVRGLTLECEGPKPVC